MKNYLLFLVLINIFLCKNDVLSAAQKLRPVPWLTEESIIFLEEFFQKNCNPKILEFGSGASTYWFAKRTSNLVSVEHDKRWFKNVKLTLESDSEVFSVDYNLVPRSYHWFCDNFPDDYFDLILVDGRNRKACLINAVRILKPGGVLMLDNAERDYYHPVFSILKDWETTITVQTKPDSCGFCYKGWTTQWWIKPVN